MPTGVIVVAAGDGTRLRDVGGGLPKALVPLAGRTILAWALDGVLAADVQHVVVVAPPSAFDRALALVGRDPRVTVVRGGTSRQRSVAAGLAALPDSVDVVLVHDAARPLTPAAQFDLVRAAVAERAAGVVPGLAVADTIKEVEAGSVLGTVDRARLSAVQTPQGFPARRLRAAYAAPDLDHTDDAALFAAAGHPVTTVAGDELAFKITTPSDLYRAELLLRPVAVVPRVGTGVDAHAFDAAVPLHLGGLEWPGEPGLAGHSDGDVICHAIADALLSAAALGDLGAVFGTDRPEEAGRAGVDFVSRAVELVAAAGFAPVNVSVQVIGNRPRLAARRAAMQDVLGRAAGAPVAISGTTTDGLGAMGRGEGLTAIATALVIRAPRPAPPAVVPASQQSRRP